MSFVGSLFSSDKGAGFQGQGTNIANPTDPAQIAAAQQQVQGALQGQQAGIGGQQNVAAQQQAFLNAVNAQNGLGNQSSVFNQLQGVANGTGPNPAAAQLAQATGANTANQAALMAGQRGSSANAGLIARQAAQQGAANQQNAAGQAATMQANQSLGALGQLGGIANSQVGQQMAQQQALAGTQQGISAAQNALSGQSLANQGQQYGAQQGVNAQNVAQQSNINNANAGIAQQNAAFQGDIFKGVASGASKGAMQFAEGGMIPAHEPKSIVGRHLGGYKPMYADGGDTSLPGGPAVVGADLYHSGVIHNPKQSKSPMGAPSAPGSPSSGGSLMAGGAGDAGGITGGAATGGLDSMAAAGPLMLAAKGGRVDALVSPGERYLTPKAVEQVQKGKKSPMKAGEKIPGKPEVGGAKNSYANDTVHKKLEAGGVILPRSVTQSKDPDSAAIKFIAATMAKNGKGLK